LHFRSSGHWPKRQVTAGLATGKTEVIASRSKKPESFTIMAKLLYSPPSPYSAKARMAATHAGVKLDFVLTDTNAEPAELISANPLGKIPVLITDEDEAIYDSRAITQYLNRISQNALFPRNAAKRTEAERLEALADGICDCLLAHVYERRMRPPEKLHQPWLDRQWDKAERTFDLLERAPPSPQAFIGEVALRTALGYADLRFERRWREGRPRLVGWVTAFDRSFPELVPLLPG